MSDYAGALDSADAMDLFMARAADHPLLSPEEERALLVRCAQGDAEARTHLINANLRLVVSIAKRYRRQDNELLDLVQDGALGLMRAIEKFDTTRNFKLSTYATAWIHQAITRGLAEKDRAIRVPVHLRERAQRVRKAQRTLAMQLGRTATLVEVGEALGLTVRQVMAALDATAPIASLDAPLGMEESYEPLSLLTTLPDDTAPALDDCAEQADRAARLRQALACLGERERRILEIRYGLGGGQGHTLEEAGAAFGITRERARQIEAEALRTLRQHAGQYGLAGLL